MITWRPNAAMSPTSSEAVVGRNGDRTLVRRSARMHGGALGALGARSAARIAARLLAPLILMTSAWTVHAQTAAPASPTTGFTSVDQADDALRDIKRQRADTEVQYTQDKAACTPAFFMTRCLDAARERRRAALARLRPLEIEANTFKRRERVVERDKVLEEKRLKAEQEAQLPPREVKIRAPANAAASVPDPNTTAPVGAPAAPAAVTTPSTPPTPVAPHAPRTPHQAKPLTPRIDARTEAANAAAFDRKAQESVRRQKEIAEKKAENERDRAAKKARAAADSGAPTTAPTNAPATADKQ